MLRTFLVVSTLLTAAGPAFANGVSTVNQTGSPTQAGVYGDGSGAAAAQSRATAAAMSGSAARATGGAGGAGGSARSHATGGTSNVTVNGGGGSGGYGDGWGRTAASAIAPGLALAGPCPTEGTTGALQLPAFGMGAGHVTVSRVCEIQAYLRDPLAFAYACRHWDGDFRAAAKDIGRPCPQDAPKEPITTVSVRSDRPDYCLTASPGELRQHRECRTVETH